MKKEGRLGELVKVPLMRFYAADLKKGLLQVQNLFLFSMIKTAKHLEKYTTNA